MNKNYVVISLSLLFIVTLVIVIILRLKEPYYNPSNNSPFNVYPKHWNWNEIKENKNIDNK